MSGLVLEGNPPIEVLLRRSARAKRLSLRVSRLDGRITLTLPQRVPMREGQAFLREKEGWIREQVRKVAAPSQLRFGTEIPFRGLTLTLMKGEGRRITVNNSALCVPGSEQQLGPRVAAFLKTQARSACAEASDRYAAKLGVSYGKITMRDTRSRWGSCSSAGDLMYSWRLVMAPVQVLDYVAAHEVAHLRHMDHSSKFWQVVDYLYPNHKPCRTWLREHGTSLHRICFD